MMGAAFQRCRPFAACRAQSGRAALGDSPGAVEWQDWGPGGHFVSATSAFSSHSFATVPSWQLGVACRDSPPGPASGRPWHISDLFYSHERQGDVARTELAQKFRERQVREEVATNFIEWNDGLAIVLCHQQKSGVE